MRRRQISRFSHMSVALVAVAAWLFASNHCALADFIPAPAAAPSEQHGHCSSPEAPAQEESPDTGCDGSKCCKSLSAPGLALAKNIVTYDSLSFAAVLHVANALSIFGEQHALLPEEIDTGPPPDHSSFAESVLQRSLLAHAPPVIA
ncbi:hypothetical protein BH20VER1_BH20VER1_13160 [soil metagenome]